jgi:hypothetical protein
MFQLRTRSGATAVVGAAVRAVAEKFLELRLESTAETDGIKPKEPKITEEKKKIRVTQRAYERPLTKLVPFHRYWILLSLKVG